MLDLNQFTGFTPGPWQSTETRNVIGTSGFHRIGRANYGVIADYIDKPTNAALIAAAPELLAECIRLRAELEAINKEAISFTEERNHDLFRPPTAPQPAPPDRQ